MKINVLNKDGSETGRKVELDKAIFEMEPNNQLIYESVRSYLANQRSGTASTKGRSEVRGGGRKAYRQKGTGMARRGTIRSPLLRGGGIVFGPKPRDYKVTLNKKMKQKARLSAFIYKLRENAILVVEDFDFEAPKTKAMTEIIRALKQEDKKILFLTGDKRINLYKSIRNIPKASVMEVSNPATYHIMHADVIVLLESSVKKLENSFKENVVEAEA